MSKNQNKKDEVFPYTPSLLCIFLLTQCKHSAEELSVTESDTGTDTDTEVVTTLCEDNPMIVLSISAADEISIEFPDCFTIEALQGIDSYVGIIEALDQEVEIYYDIGYFAGAYVQENSPGQTTVQGTYEEFRYKIMNDLLILTFPEAGPANFNTSQIEHLDDLVEVFKSLKVN